MVWNIHIGYFLSQGPSGEAADRGESFIIVIKLLNKTFRVSVVEIFSFPFGKNSNFDYILEKYFHIYYI